MKKMKTCSKITVFVLMVSMLLMLLPAGIFAADGLDNMGSVISGTVDYYRDQPTLESWWELAALKGAGEDLNAEVWKNKLPHWQSSDLNKDRALVTDYAGYILGYMAMDQDPSTIWQGRNIVEELASKQAADGSFGGGTVNMHIWSMIALDAAGGEYDREKATAWLLSQQKEDGGFALTPSDASDPDFTGMALAVMAGHKGQQGVDAAIEKAVSFLKGIQCESGGFSSWGTENSNSAAAVITGLVSCGQDVTSDNWKKGGKSVLDALLSYRLSDGSFSYKIGEGSNSIATVQCLMALADANAGKSIFQRLGEQRELMPKKVHVRVEGIKGNIADADVKVVSDGKPQTGMDALKQLLDSKNISYTLQNGYLSSVAGDAAGKFGGWDGWLYIVNGKMMDVGAGDYKINEGDDIVFYYGMYPPDTLIPEVDIKPEQPKTGDPLTVTVSSSYLDWQTGKTVNVSIPGAVVSFNGSSYTTDEKGQAFIPAVNEFGIYQLKVSKDSEDSYPGILRTGGINITYYPPEDLYSDARDISDWASQDVEKAALYHLMNGTGGEGKRFEPGRTITRAEFTALIVRLIGEQPSASAAQVFQDVSPDSWYAGYVFKAKEKGIVNGVEENVLFAPDKPISREEMAVMIGRAFNLTSVISGSGGIRDMDSASRWARAAIVSVYQNGIMTGSDGIFDPQGPATREMAAVVAVRLYEMER